MAAKTKRETVQELFAERVEQIESEKVMLRETVESAKRKIFALDEEQERLDALFTSVDGTLTQTRNGANDSDGEEE